jgi:magnesium chelatase subunit D
MGHQIIFVLDGSGSMGAKERMTATKGAIASVLLDCYQKRDKVALVVFRKSRAFVALPPTSSMELASRLLADLPTGGNTPLAMGLAEAERIIRNQCLKRPGTRFVMVLITDGRANQGLSDLPVQAEIKKILRGMSKAKDCDYIVIDTENKESYLKRDLALKMASDLGADYFTLETLRGESVAGILKPYLEAGS